MRTLIAIALVASAGFATLAQAQTLATSDSDSSSVRIQGVQSPRMKLSDVQFRDYSGGYIMANGQTLTLSRMNQRYFAQLGDGREVEIVPTAHKRFVATNGDMRIDFDEYLGSRTNDVVLRTGLRSNNVAVLASR
ncbi:MAG: hypothetical protein V4631_09050 [Pseudomonadota bacterium]